MMSLTELCRAFEEGKTQYQRIMEEEKGEPFALREIYGTIRSQQHHQIRNRIASGDNLDYMIFLLKQEKMAGKMQLIYVDPPFFSNGKYQASIYLESEELGRSGAIKAEAYDDCWNRGMTDYLTMLTVRFFLMRDLLAETGCIWVHLDHHVVHYAKVILDQIFGTEELINEVIWTYKSGGANKRSFARKHDNLLFYGKSKAYKFHGLREKSYNRGLKPYRFQGVEEFEDEVGWYTMVHMKDVWNIDMVGRTSGERTGYATQKPEKLLERIITACTDPGDLCADFFGGSGTLGAVCGRLGRNWILCDTGKIAIANQIKRLSTLQETEVFAVEESQDFMQRQGNLEVEVDPEENAIRLTRYDPDNQAICSAQQELVRTYLEKDSLSLIKFWSVDPDFDGKTHRQQVISFDGHERLVLPEEKRWERLSIVGYDAWGNRFATVREK